MRKRVRNSQMFRVTGRPIGGFEMYKYGLPYDGAAGTFFAKKTEHVDLMLAAVERHPEIHVVTYFKDGSAVNRYEPKNAYTHYLHLGNADPEIEFSKEWRADDYTDEEWERYNKRKEEFLNSPWTTEDIAAVNWMLKKGLNT